MNTSSPKPHLRPSILAISVATLLGLLAGEAAAADRVWNPNSGSATWNTAGNWTGDNAPNTAGETARFQLSGTTNLNISSITTMSLDGIVFDPGASAFVINKGRLATLNLNVEGIVNNSGIVQTINNNSAGSRTIFNNGATAGSNVVINNSGIASSTTFNNSASAGSARINNSAGTVLFNNASTAGEATIFNTGSVTSTIFSGTATAGTSAITNSGAGSFTSFTGTSTAGEATIFNTGVLTSTTFSGTATAGTAKITNSGAGLFTSFIGSSTGGQATLINTVAGAFVDISLLTTLGMKVGAIAGTGNFYLGAKNLEVGGNNASTEVTGVIRDGGPLAPAAVGGSLTKVGTGQLTLSGANLYTGKTIVNEGALLVNGSTLSPETVVNLLGLLGGSGTVGGSLVNYGTLSPGNSPGTLTVEGNYSQEGSGNLRLEVASTGVFDKLQIGGSATLGGTLTAVGVDGYAPKRGDVMTFLAATGGVNGEFADLDDAGIGNGTILEFDLHYEANQVSLAVVQGSFAALPDLTPNQKAVAVALDSVAFHSEVPEFIDFLDEQQIGNLPRQFDQIAPEELTAVFSIATALANVQMTNLQRRLEDVRGGSTGFSGQHFALQGGTADFQGGLGLAGVTGKQGKSFKEGPMVPAPENRWGFFAHGSGEFIDVENTGNSTGYDFESGGVTFGLDYRVCANLAVGLTVGYAHTSADLPGPGHISADGGRLGVYATAFGNGFYLDTAATVGLNRYDIRRSALRGSAYGDTDGTEVDVLVGAGYNWRIGALTLGPIANFQYTSLDLGGFTERGSLVPLTFSDQSGESIRTTFGLKASYDWKWNGCLIRPELRVSWEHQYGDTAAKVVSSFANTGGSAFTVAGPDIGDDSLVVGAGFSVRCSETASFFLYYDGQFGASNYQANAISGGFRIEF